MTYQISKYYVSTKEIIPHKLKKICSNENKKS